MDDRKNTRKSSQGARKHMGDKLKNETSRGEAMRKKLRHGKKDNRMTQEEKKELSKLRAQGRKKAYRQAAVSAEARKQVVRNEDENVGTEAMDAGLATAETGIRQASSSRYSSKLYEKQHTRQLKEEKKAKNAEGDGSKTGTRRYVSM